MRKTTLLVSVIDVLTRLAGAMEGEGVSLDQFELPINSHMARRNLANYLKAGCPEVTYADGISDEELARHGMERSPYGREGAKVRLGQGF